MMDVRLNLEPLVKKITETDLIKRLADGLGIHETSADMRYRRVRDGDIKHLDLEFLSQILMMARQYQVAYEELFLLEQSSIFKLMEPKNTFTFIGAYGALAPEDWRYTSRVNTSVWDLRAARRFAPMVTCDYTKLRYVPAALDGIARATAHVEAAKQNRSCLISLGSNKVNAVSELIIAEALGYSPFTPWPAWKTDEKPVFRFEFLIPQAQFREREEKNLREYATARFIENTPDSRPALIWDNQTYPLIEPTIQLPGSGRDVAIVLVHALDAKYGRILVSGISGLGTFGASAMICWKPECLELPHSSAYVRVFLIEILLERFNVGGGGAQAPTEPAHPALEPRKACVLAYWDPQTGYHTYKDLHKQYIDVPKPEL